MLQFGQDSHTARSHTRISFKRKGLGFTSVLWLPSLICMCRGWEVVGEGSQEKKVFKIIKDSTS